VGMIIGVKTQGAIVEAIKGLFNENLHAINDAYESSGELGVSIAVKLGDQGRNGVNTAVQLTFVKEKVRSECKFSVDEKQMGLFGAVEDFKNSIPEGTTVTMSSGSRTVNFGGDAGYAD